LSVCCSSLDRLNEFSIQPNEFINDNTTTTVTMANSPSNENNETYTPPIVIPISCSALALVILALIIWSIVRGRRMKKLAALKTVRSEAGAGCASTTVKMEPSGGSDDVLLNELAGSSEEGCSSDDRNDVSIYYSGVSDAMPGVLR